jgi:hypothetical protein
MFAEQAAPQLRLPPPAQVAVTVPLPLPCFAMMKLAFLTANVALTVAALVIVVSAHVVPVVVVQPDHELKSESLPGVATRESDEPELTDTVQVGFVHDTVPSAVAIVPWPLAWIVT